VEGVRVLKVCRKSAGFPVFRFFHPKWTGLVKAMRKANADVYYHNCGENVTGQVGLWCHQNHRAFVFSSANETDCDAELPELPYWRDRWLYRYGLGKADQIIVQTETQRAMMKRNFARDAKVIPMPSPRPQRPVHVRVKPVSNRVLWVGRVCSQKRPDRLMEAAQLMPDLQFDLVGPHFDDAIARAALARAAGLANVRVHGPVSREKLGELYQDAACLLCTSDYEGFPNTFLEAWSNALPIVSTFDPDGLIAKRGMGLVAAATDDLVASLRELLGSNSLYATASANGLSYFLEHHVADRVLPRFERVFVEAAENVGRRR
jgi:glycosyltransferase involved in cell wall biosynthesis